ncbi:sensor histidine kinase [Goodfellowiella coeruleoviolacea]|uniref:sensor histidine kinase n=1 Tax=Goodfellowiella coeruleoviolacea TaxID=334858 RepID=UPI0020A43DC7|nr:sensor histidine kinase [Goodfellowiella coeruleoviolacea]
MPDNPRRPVPAHRLPPSARTALTWCAVAGLTLVLWAALGAGPEPAHGQPPGSLRLAGWPRLVVAALLALPLRWARSRPLPVLAAVVLGFLAVTTSHARIEQAWPLVLAADALVALVAATRPRHVAAVAATATLVGQEAVWQRELWASGGAPRLLAVGMLALTALIALLVLLAWVAGTMVRQRRDHAAVLREHAATQAAAAERLRIARELHDVVAHGIGVIAIQAGAAGRVIGSRPDAARDALAAIETTSRDTLKGLRQLLGGLRATEVAEPAGLTGLAGVDRLAETTTAAGVRVEVRWRGRNRPLPSTVDHSAFRIIQEAVTNVVRHAGTDHCRVLIDHRGEELCVEVLDSGGGRAAGAGESGYGIAGMRERVALLGGQFSAGPRPEGGFRVTARLPLLEAAR